MRTPHSTTNPFSSALATAIRFVGRVREAQERRRVVVSLASLDDHMLRDIGLTRFDVDSALVEPSFNDATLVLAERAGTLRQHQRAMAQEAQAWAALMPPADGRTGKASPARRVA